MFTYVINIMYVNCIWYKIARKKDKSERSLHEAQSIESAGSSGSYEASAQIAGTHLRKIYKMIRLSRH